VNLTASAANGSDCGRRHRNLIKTPYLDCSLSLARLLAWRNRQQTSHQRAREHRRRLLFRVAQFFRRTSRGGCRGAGSGIIASSLSAVTTSSVTNTVLRNAAALFGMIPIYITYVGLRILVGQLFFSVKIFTGQVHICSIHEIQIEDF
jgi:hypothetical protein